MSVTRRALLAGALGTAVVATACRDHKPGTQGARPDPDAPALAAAASSERALMGALAATGAHADLVVHSSHLAALEARLPAGGTTSPGRGPVSTDVDGLLRDSAVALRAAALAAIDGAAAAVLASVGAAHASARPARSFSGAWWNGKQHG